MYAPRLPVKRAGTLRLAVVYGLSRHPHAWTVYTSVHSTLQSGCFTMMYFGNSKVTVRSVGSGRSVRPQVKCRLVRRLRPSVRPCTVKPWPLPQARLRSRGGAAIETKIREGRSVRARSGRRLSHPCYRMVPRNTWVGRTLRRVPVGSTRGLAPRGVGSYVGGPGLSAATVPLLTLRTARSALPQKSVNIHAE